MMNKIQLVICDVDSTLVNDQRELTPRTKKLIDTLHQQHIYFGIASGRPLDEIMKYANNWGIEYPFDVLIGMNGSELWDGVHNTTYSYFKLKTEWMKEIMDMMSSFECNPMMYYQGKILCMKNDDMMKKSARSSNKEIIVAKDSSAFYQEENAKLMFRMKKELMSEAEAFVEKHPSPYYQGFKTQDTLLEFADKRITKAYALEKFCTMNHFPLSNVIAFGDTTNDNDMLVASGLGVCMCNGSDDTKAIANDITEFDNNQDGFAIYMEKLLMDNKEN